MNVIYLLKDCAASRRLAKKLCKAKPNEIILLDDAEIIRWREAQQIVVSDKGPLYFDDNLLETGE